MALVGLDDRPERTRRPDRPLAGLQHPSLWQSCHKLPAAALEGLHQADLDAPGRMTSMLPAGPGAITIPGRLVPEPRTLAVLSRLATAPGRDSSGAGPVADPHGDGL